MLSMYPPEHFEKGFLQDAYYNLWKNFSQSEKDRCAFRIILNMHSGLLKFSQMLQNLCTHLLSKLTDNLSLIFQKFF